MNVSEKKLEVKCFYENFDFNCAYRKRFLYLNAVDSYISTLKKNPSLLDLGAGNGERTNRIAKKMNAQVTTVDIAVSSYESCKKNSFVSYQENIESFCIKNTFDIITCLWSVMGYVNTYNTLKNVKSMLATDGVFFFDVNVRYNIAEYGLYNCARNLLSDFFVRSSGFEIGGCKVYLFNYWELDGILKKIGFKYKKIYLNYSTGKRTCVFMGQLLYICTHDLVE